jgi:DNA-binding beta-propeller fold protein YncE
LRAWGEAGSGPGQLRSPIGIAISDTGHVYITDVNNARVQKFTADGEYVSGFDLPWDKPDRRMTMAGGIIADADGIYLSLMQQHKIALYRDDGSLVREFGTRGAGTGELDGPGGIVLAPDRTLYVADQQNHRIQRFTLAGTLVSAWGGYGSEPGRFGGGEPAGSRFGGPHFLARDSQGRLYTTEGARGRVQVFTSDGQFLTTWGKKGDQPGSLGAHKRIRGDSLGPIAIAVDGHDHVLVSSLNDRVQIFTSNGTYLLGFGGTGNGPGQFWRPHGMAFDSQGHLYVADAGNQRIQKFAMPDLRARGRSSTPAWASASAIPLVPIGLRLLR